ncbi:MAG TPA: NACHT domain-containing protein, partial [Ktedonobacteraceae bacterium]|nr:NACHT domain-containing protein [Ktedonobacteraceae bacterium]
MALVEALSIEVGASIAKAILKRWLNNDDLISDAAASVIDILKAQTSDKIAQQRANRQFESIGEKVGESLLPVFEQEGAKFDEETRTAIALAAAETLNAATSEVLARRNLQPIEVARYLLNAYPPASYHFSDAEGRLYERIISEACTYIIDIASQLPQFTERTLAEVLKREGQLIAIAEKILQEVARMRAALDPELEAAQFELDYRRAVIRHLDELELFGSGMSMTSRKYSLSLAYVSLSLEQTVEYTDPHFDERAAMLFHTEKEERGPRTIRQVMSIDELLPDAQLLLIRGEAGSGKTTLLQWIAVQSAAQSFSPQLQAWNGTIPFYIRLRQHTHTDASA